MQWTRRHFLQITGSAAAAMGLGVAGIAIDRILSGCVSFSEWRALPGMALDLTLDVAHPEKTSVDIVAQTDRGYFRLDTLKGAKKLKIDVPYIDTAKESYMLVAVVRDGEGRSRQSDPVEVLTEPFMFGM